MTFLKNLEQTLIALDQLINCCLGTIISIFLHSHKVYADETISAYLWRRHNYWYINILRVCVDALFYPFLRSMTHCEKAYESEIKRAHSPSDK